MTCAAGTWASFGLPSPDAEGYRYSIGAGLVRTRFADGSVLQRRRYWHWPRAWSVQWTVRPDVLHTFSAWAMTCGYDWFALDLVSGDGSVLTSHSVRMTSDLQVARIAGGLCRVVVELEQAAGDPDADITGFSLPIPEQSGYSYAVDSGLISTPFPASLRRQERRYTSAPRLFQVQWFLSLSDLAKAETWINANGFSWFDLDLLSGESGTAIPTTHSVRIASDLNVTAVSAGYMRLSCTLEEPCNNAVAALEQIPDNALGCIDTIPTVPPISTSSGELAAAWGDSTDWGRLN